MSLSKSESGIAPTSENLIGGKRYAGVIVNARPFVELWPRCICGYLSGRDHHNRGFDNGPIRTSTVDRLLVQEGDVYAITQNSAYLLASLELMSFLDCPEWIDDVRDLVNSEWEKTID
ncbi:putative methyltransferase [Salmonella phage 40]|nr:putative methyltransferase [Salmonella phage 40]